MTRTKRGTTSTKRGTTSTKRGTNRQQAKRTTQNENYRTYMVSDDIEVSVYINDDMADNLYESESLSEVLDDNAIYCTIHYYDLIIKDCYLRVSKDDNIFLSLPQRKYNDTYKSVAFFIDENQETLNCIVDVIVNGLYTDFIYQNDEENDLPLN